MAAKSMHSPQASTIEQLPDDVLVLILCFLPTLAEIQRTSVLSRRWRYVWHRITCLEFDATSLLRTPARFRDSLDWYVAWVNNVLNRVPAGVKQLKLFYKLDESHTHHIDPWISFSAANPIERLHLEFSGYTTGIHHQYKLLENAWLKAPSGLSNIKCLKSLFLVCVDVRQEFVSFIISNCPLLEDLTLQLPGLCEVLDISGHPPPLRLRRLEILASRGFALSKLCAPHLTSFNLRSHKFSPFQLDVPMLTDLTLCGCLHPEEEGTMQDLEHFWSYLPRLERLGLVFQKPEALGVEIMPKLVNLKFLKLTFGEDTDPFFNGIVFMIRACPVLETFALQIFGLLDPPSNRRCKRSRNVDKYHFFERLKVLELYGSVLDLYGSVRMRTIMDQKIVNCIVKNSPRLEKLIVGMSGTIGLRDYSSLFCPHPPSVLQKVETIAKDLCRGSPNEIEVKVIPGPL